MKSKNQTKRILIISVGFAPSSKVGSKRFTFLASLLQKRYPDLHVLTRKEKDFSLRDDSLPITGIIHRTWIYPPYPIRKNNILKKIFRRLWTDYLCLIDPSSGWIFPALLKGLKIIKNNEIDLIIATCPTFSAMVIGYLLSLMTKAKLILDYRDPWTVRTYKYCKLFGKGINKFFERRAVRYASALVFCSRIMREDLVSSLGNTDIPICHIITNGFHDNASVSPIVLGDNKKNIVYAGSFYGERKISLLAKPISHLIRSGFLTKKDVGFDVFGMLNNQDRQMIERYGLKDIIREHPRVPYKQILRYLKGADILFLASGSDVRYAIPFKFFDYLSVKRPILAVAPEYSGLAEVMSQIDCGEFASIDDEDSIVEKLRTMILKNKRYSFSGAQQYTWEEIARKYSAAIDQVNLGKRF